MKIYKKCHARDKIPNSCFYVPCLYFAFVRMGTLGKCFGFFSYFILPTFYYFFYSAHFSLSYIPIYVLSFLLLYNLYEIGYIENDTEAIKRELNPSVRLYPYNLAYYERHKGLIYSVKLLTGIFFNVCLLLAVDFQVGSIWFSCMSWSLLFLFFLYNRIRTRLSLLLFISLQVLKFIAFALFFYPFVQLVAIVGLLLAYPFSNVVERLSYERYGIVSIRRWLPDKSCFTAFRCGYLGIVTLGYIILNLLDLVTYWDYLVFIYLFLFRLLLYALLRNHIKPANYLS